MPVLRILALVGAGVGGGLAGSVAGLASLVSYPALLALGLNPIGANVTNTVALVFGGAGSALGSRPEMVGQGRRLGRLGAAGAAGGLAGAVLLLATPAGSFALVVPWLIGLGSVTILVGSRRVAAAVDAALPDPSATPVGVLVATFAIAVYGGYFGAAAGVLLLALLLATLRQDVARSNAVKNVVLAAANGIAAIVFAVWGPVHWLDAVPLAAGFLLGGRLGPSVARAVPGRWLRVGIALAGLGLAVDLGVAAYR